MAPDSGTQLEDPPVPLRFHREHSCWERAPLGSSPTHPGKSDSLTTCGPPQPLAWEVRSQARTRERGRGHLLARPVGCKKVHPPRTQPTISPMTRCGLTAGPAIPFLERKARVHPEMHT